MPIAQQNSSQPIASRAMRTAACEKSAGGAWPRNLNRIVFYANRVTTARLTRRGAIRSIMACGAFDRVTMNDAVRIKLPAARRSRRCRKRPRPESKHGESEQITAPTHAASLSRFDSLFSIDQTWSAIPASIAGMNHLPYGNVFGFRAGTTPSRKTRRESVAVVDLLTAFVGTRAYRASGSTPR